MLRIIILAFLIVVLLLTLLIFFQPYVKKQYHLRHFRHYMGRKVYRVAKDYDYCLLQNFTMQLDSKHTAHFDHILFGDKYFYCVVDKSWKGSVIGSAHDEHWIYYHPRTNQKQMIKNPLRVNKTRLEKFSLLTGIDEEMLISIVVVNDECTFSCSGLRSDTEYIVHASDFKKLIHEIEHRDVPPFEAQAIEKLVSEVYQLNKS